MSGNSGGDGAFVVLLVDDSDDVHILVKALLARGCYQGRVALRSAHDGYEALEIAKQAPISLVLSDINMPRMTGPGLISALREAGQDMPVVLIGAVVDQDVPGAAGIIDKDELLESVAGVLDHYLPSY